MEKRFARTKFGALALALFAVVGCGEASVSQGGSTSSASQSVTSSTESEAGPTVLREAGTPIVPAESLDDIARWGSLMLVVSVTREEARNTSSAGPGEVEIGRDLDVRVEQVLWEHPQAVTKVSPGDELSLYTFPGFVEVDGQRSPAAPENSVRMDVGQQYVVALTDDVVDGAQVLTLLTTLRLESDSMQLPSSQTVSRAEVSADLERLRADDLNTGPREGESLVQRVERVG